MKDWTQICEQYRGMWVAIDDDEETVVAADRKLDQAIALKKALGKPNAALFRVPDEIVDFVGYGDMAV